MITKTPGSAKLSFLVDAIYNASVRNRGRSFARMASSRGIDGVNVPSSEDPTGPQEQAGLVPNGMRGNEEDEVLHRGAFCYICL